VLDRGCTGHVPKIMDGDAPHTRRECGAQAWGASELLGVREPISKDKGWRLAAGFVKALSERTV